MKGENASYIQTFFSLKGNPQGGQIHRIDAQLPRSASAIHPSALIQLFAIAYVDPRSGSSVSFRSIAPG